ncbi:MAG: protein-tyrosine-phosphatase [Bacteroidetes bacterium]|nr:protein-tyrosine-phosphatase [Bacteroidota bacterium]
MLRSTIAGALSTQDSIPPARRQTLERLAAWIAEKSRSGEDAPLIFICTHNSRRSHFGQIWAQTAAWTLGLEHVRTFSGGTEATAFHPNAVRALQGQGFGIRIETEGENPLYAVQAGPQLPDMSVFSKRFDNDTNPSSGFAAVMTCSDADEACPVVPGAAARFSLPYDDPKQSDGSGQEAIVYAERSLQIASEMLFVMREAGRRKQ